MTVRSDTQRVSNLLNALSLAIGERAASRAAAETGCDASLQRGALALANFAEGQPMSVLQRGLGLSQPGAVRQLDRLERAGLAVRRRGEDGREVRPRLTEAGRRLARRAMVARLEATTEILGELDQGVVRSLAGPLEAMLTALTTDAESSWRICHLCDPGACGHPERCPVTQAASSTQAR
jgi:DNA-binding MarR family transcriptional regulator